jgi:hypothetical protein
LREVVRELAQVLLLVGESEVDHVLLCSFSVAVGAGDTTMRQRDAPCAD